MNDKDLNADRTFDNTAPKAKALKTYANGIRELGKRDQEVVLRLNQDVEWERLVDELFEAHDIPVNELTNPQFFFLFVLPEHGGSMNISNEEIGWSADGMKERWADAIILAFADQ